MSTNLKESNMTDAIKSANAKWDATFNAADAEGLAALYSANATLVSPTGTTIQGTAAIREFWSGLFKAGFKAHKIELLSTREEGKLTIVVGKWQATGPDENGAPKQYGGQVVNILETQTDGQVRSILHTWN